VIGRPDGTGSLIARPSAAEGATTAPSTAQRLLTVVERAARSPLPIQLRAWDGSTAGPTDPVLAVHLRSPRAVRGALRPAAELGAARAYVSGDLEFEPIGGHDEISALCDQRMIAFAGAARTAVRSPLRKLSTMAALTRLAGPGPGPGRPPEEATLSGRRHGRGRDAAAIAHHYDLGNDFYRLILGESMVYSCAYWRADPDDDYGLEQAQRDKLDRICRKLGLKPGHHLLDIGCGWGSLAVHAAEHYGAHVVGITLSEAQATMARRRVHDAGVAGLVTIRVQDYRDLADGPYDAVASVGMAEHLGSARYARYAATVRKVLRPGGRLLHHQITVPAPAPRRRRKQFIDRYIFPDGELTPLGHISDRLERSGLEVVDVESMREHYVPTLRAWLHNLDHNRGSATELTSPGRVRAWRLYLAGSAAGFASGRLALHQVLAVVPWPGGRSPLPRLRSTWLPGG
jgi:cyclopropane-fatty-acyl-phospholipid synthase